MLIVLGGTGHAGSSVAVDLLEQGEQVTVITRDNKKTKEWERRGAKNAVVDVLDSKKLKEIFRTGTRLFLLNPPAGQDRYFLEIGDPVENRNSLPPKLDEAEKAERGKKAEELAAKYRTEILVS
jgi:uncharacterized protein YbjT (DUF2867 family)